MIWLFNKNINVKKWPTYIAENYCAYKFFFFLNQHYFVYQEAQMDQN